MIGQFQYVIMLKSLSKHLKSANSNLPPVPYKEIDPRSQSCGFPRMLFPCVQAKHAVKRAELT